MSSIKLAEYVLWKSIKQKRENEISTKGSLFSFSYSKIEEIVFPEMICRVCTSPADISIMSTFNGINILSAIRTVSSVWVSSTDPYPKYICKNCLEELKVALDFKKKCESSHYMFHRVQPQRIDISSPMVMHDFAFIIHQMTERRLARIAGRGGRSHSRRKN